MDGSAIEKLQIADQITKANSALSERFTSNQPRVVALHKDFAIQNLESFEPNRARFRGNFSTAEPDAFANYALSKSAPKAGCFINAQNMSAQLIFNLGTQELPGHCDDKARLSLEMTAPYKALLAVADKRLSQKEVAEFIEDWRKLMSASSEEDADGNTTVIPLAKAIYAIRKITIEQKATTESETRNFGATNSSMDSIDVKSADMPPAYLHFTCEPYRGLAVRTFNLRLSVITDRQPSLTLRIVRHETEQEEMAKEFEAIINTKLGEIEPRINTFIGDFAA